MTKTKKDLYTQKIIDMVCNDTGHVVHIDLTVLRQYLQHAQLNVDESYNLLRTTLLPCRQYAVGRYMVSQSTALFKKVMQELKHSSAEQCVRLLIVMVDSNGNIDKNLTAIDALFHRLNKLRALQTQPLIAKTVIMITQSIILKSTILAARIIKYLPDLNVVPVLSETYFPRSVCQYKANTRWRTLLMTMRPVSLSLTG